MVWMQFFRRICNVLMLWSGAFDRLPRSAPRAGFGDHRFFSYQGKPVGESYHLGLDLASVRNAEVPAGNSGRVVFCADNGIYGNLIVIDHGLGLMSLYSHLNDTMRTRSFRCRDCGNRCLLTETRFSHGTRHIAGNRCDRFSEAGRGTPPAPNIFAWKNQRLFRYEPLPLEDAPRGRLGIPRVLNVYAHYPFWFTLFSSLGFRVEVSPPTSRALFAAGLSSVPSQSVCYPAKLAHGHVLALLESGVKHVFFPCIPRETKEFTEMCDSFSCPVACGYPQVVRENLPELHDAGATLHAPFVNLAHTASLVRNLCREFNLPRAEVRASVRVARHEQARYQRELHAEAERIYADVIRAKGVLVVIAGRPYHAFGGFAVGPQAHKGSYPDWLRHWPSP